MGTIPSRRSRASRTSALIALGAAATLIALGAGMLTIGSSLSAAFASAEITAAVMLPTRNVWILPALFSVMVFVGIVVAVYLIGGRGGSHVTEGAETSDASASAQAAPIELRAPERAVAEVRRGLLHPFGY